MKTEDVQTSLASIPSGQVGQEQVLFKVIENHGKPDAREYTIYTSGRVEGFTAESVIVQNRYHSLLATHLATG